MTNTRRERLVVLALGVVGAALALLTATRPWLDVTIKNPLIGSGRLHPEGRDVAALVPAAALVALAASVAAVTLRRVGRHIAGLLLVAAGAGIASATDGGSAGAALSLRVATGRTGNVAATASVGSIWPWLALLSAVPIVLAGAVTIVRGRAWSGLSRRYDPPTAEDPVGDDADEAWDALSRGEDPTR